MLYTVSMPFLFCGRGSDGGGKDEVVELVAKISDHCSGDPAKICRQEKLIGAASLIFTLHILSFFVLFCDEEGDDGGKKEEREFVDVVQTCRHLNLQTGPRINRILRM